MLKKGTVSFLCFCLFALSGHAQRRLIQNQPSYDLKWIHFGFIIGYNNADFVPVANRNINSNDTVYNVYPNASPGFNLQILANLRLLENFDLRFLPGLSFAGRDLNYDIQFQGQKVTQTVKKTVNSNFVELP